MRRTEGHSATGHSTALEIALVVALIGSALTLSVLGDQAVALIGAAIANLHAS